LVRVLRLLNESSAWRALFGMKAKRLKDLELILRFFAFYYYADKYRSPMKDFLNRYMASNRDLRKQNEAELVRTFESTTSIIAAGIGTQAFRPTRAVNAAVVDSLMVGVARRLAAGPIKRKEDLSHHYSALLRNKDYRDATETGTSQEANVANRLRLATEAFESVK
jgi:hypothetical protein